MAKKKAKLYRETIWVHPNLSITVHKLPESVKTEMGNTLADSKVDTITISGKNTKKTQIIPRNKILLVEFEEEVDEEQAKKNGA